MKHKSCGGAVYFAHEIGYCLKCDARGPFFNGQVMMNPSKKAKILKGVAE